GILFLQVHGDRVALVLEQQRIDDGELQLAVGILGGALVEFGRLALVERGDGQLFGRLDRLAQRIEALERAGEAAMLGLQAPELGRVLPGRARVLALVRAIAELGDEHPQAISQLANRRQLERRRSAATQHRHAAERIEGPALGAAERGRDLERELVLGLVEQQLLALASLYWACRAGLAHADAATVGAVAQLGEAAAERRDEVVLDRAAQRSGAVGVRVAILGQARERVVADVEGDAALADA